MQCGYCQSGQIMAAAALLEGQARADRRRHRRRAERQHLPLRHLPADPRRRPPRGRTDAEAASMSATPASTRRAFLRDVGARPRGGLVIAFYVPAAAAWRRAGRRTPPPPSRCPIPTRSCASAPTTPSPCCSRTRRWARASGPALPMLIAEELDADWSKISVEHAPAAPAYAHTVFGMQMTGGSTSTWSEFDRYRQVGAHGARRCWSRPRPQQLERAGRATAAPRTGVVIAGTRRAALRRARRGGGEAAAADRGRRSRTPKDWKIIGKPTSASTTPEKITGRAQFGIDVQFPGLLTAVVARPPVFGGKVKRFDGARGARRCPACAVVQVPRGVAVVADHFWAAKLGRDALEVEWDSGRRRRARHRRRCARTYRAAGRASPGAVDGQGRGDRRGGAGDGGEGGRGRVRRAVPRARADGAAQLHGADRRGQVRDLDRHPVPDRRPAGRGEDHRPQARAGRDPHAVPRRRLRPARHARRPTSCARRCRWPRPPGCRSRWCGRARTTCAAATTGRRTCTACRSASTPRALPIAWQHVIVGQSILAGTPFEAIMIKDGIDATSVEGVADSPYLTDVPEPPRGAALAEAAGSRCCGGARSATPHRLRHGDLVDELAHAAGQGSARVPARACSRTSAPPRRARTWPPRRPAGARRCRRAARAASRCTSRSAASSRRWRRCRSTTGASACTAWSARSTAARRSTRRASRRRCERRVAFGLAAALYGELTCSEGRVQQSNFHDYQVLRMHEMPEVEVHIVPSTEKPGGVGEPGVPPIAPAVANAVFARHRPAAAAAAAPA